MWNGAIGRVQAGGSLAGAAPISDQRGQRGEQLGDHNSSSIDGVSTCGKTCGSPPPGG